MESNQQQFEVLLPIGYTDESGRTHRQAWIRKMRGHEEVLLYDPSLTAGRLVTELIRSCLVRLGTIEEVDSELVGQLYTADRNYCLLEIRRITLGDRLAASYPCPRCGAGVAVIEDLGHLEVRRLGEDERLGEMTVVLDDGYTDRAGTTHSDLALSLPRGVDEEIVSPMVEKDPMTAQDALLLRCIGRFGELSRAALEAYGVKILRELTMGDRQRIQAALGHEAPGVDFQRTMQCGPCGSRFEGVMDVSNFFAAG
jgi:hypothetical protein